MDAKTQELFRKQGAQILVLQEMVATLLAERAAMAGDPAKKLEQIFADEANQVYAVVANEDAPPETVRIYKYQAEARKSLMNLATSILPRVKK